MKPGFLSPITLNERGDVAFAFLLKPFPNGPPAFPAGVPAGVYRFSSSAHTLSPVVIPGVTRAPGGGFFAGAGFGASLNDRGDLVFSGIVPTDKGLPDPGSGAGAGPLQSTQDGGDRQRGEPGRRRAAGRRLRLRLRRVD